MTGIVIFASIRSVEYRRFEGGVIVLIDYHGRNIRNTPQCVCKRQETIKIYDDSAGPSTKKALSTHGDRINSSESDPCQNCLASVRDGNGLFGPTRRICAGNRRFQNGCRFAPYRRAIYGALRSV